MIMLMPCQGVCLLLGAPMLFSAAWMVIRPWLDPVTQAKVQFVKRPDLVNFIPIDAIPVCHGGEDTTDYHVLDQPSQAEAE
mmetsp:Transcript_44217/g.69138  ORF Transcript_44217/g.69138 Transcript_44217/m.69138 type:complete len:81 (-) Transcript_44217:256-498(-)